MKIIGMGLPELVVLAVIIAIIALIVFAVTRIGKRPKASGVYKELIQLDELHTRGIISDAEYAAKRDELKSIFDAEGRDHALRQASTYFDMMATEINGSVACKEGSYEAVGYR